MELQYLKIGDLCNVSSSKRVFARQYVDEGIPFYRQKEIIDKKNGNPLEEPIYISESVYNEFKDKSGVPENGDLLITAVGALGIPYIVDNEKFYFKDGNIIWLSNFKRELNSQFLFYWIDSNFGTQTLWNRTIGSAQPALTIDSIKKLTIPIPSRKIQDKIASTLKMYDKMLENNNKRIRLLNQMAENLYKEWFVRFRFPGYEDVKFENGIPEGWKRIKLKEFIKKSGKSIKKENLEESYKYVPIDFINSKSIALRKYDDLENASSSLQTFQEKDILFGAMRPYFHKVSIADFKGVTRSTCFVIQPIEEDYLYYVLMMLFQESTVNFATTISVGSTMPYVRWEDFVRMNTLKPTKSVISDFYRKMAPLIKEMNILVAKNEKLTKQRDLLLPRLMSGKLEV